MAKILVSDFSYVLLFPKDREGGGRPTDIFAALSDDRKQSVFDTFELNDSLMEFIKGVKKTNQTILFTNGSMHTVPEIRAELDDVFTQCFSASDIGFSKKNSQAYTELAKILQTTPNQLVFIDDLTENVTAAKEAGVTAIQYKNNEQIIVELRRQLL